ncbi:hypothetical protein TYRP_023338, partial [Tyrophagus putrescentiae]
FGQRLTLTTLWHCERERSARGPSRWTFTVPKCRQTSPLRAVHCYLTHKSAFSYPSSLKNYVSPLIQTHSLKMKILVKLNKLATAHPCVTWPHQERPPPRTSLAPLASPSSAGVLGWPSDARPRLLSLAAHSDVTWPLSNAFLLGPRSLRSRDPRRQSLTTAKSRQVTKSR